MKNATIRLVVMTSLAGLLATGCYTKHEVVTSRGAATAPGEVVISSEPPPPRHEVRTAPSSSAQVWIEGNWVYRDGRWVWMPGHWETRPNPTSAYVPGYWKHTIDGWVFVQGYWQ